MIFGDATEQTHGRMRMAVDHSRQHQRSARVDRLFSRRAPSSQARARFPIPVIASPSIATAPSSITRNSASIVTTVPPLMNRSKVSLAIPYFDARNCRVYAVLGSKGLPITFRSNS